MLGKLLDSLLQPSLDARNPYSSGLRYLHGHRMPGSAVTKPDYARALSCFHEAAKQGDARAMYQLSAMVVNGQGCIANVEAGLGWLKAAAENGDARAQADVGQRAELLGDVGTARSWYSMAAAQGDSLGNAGLQRLTPPASQPAESAPNEGVFRIGGTVSAPPYAYGLRAVKSSRIIASKVVDGLVSQLESTGGGLVSLIRSEPGAAETQYCAVYVAAYYAYAVSLPAVSDSVIAAVWRGINDSFFDWLPSDALHDQMSRRIYQLGQVLCAEIAGADLANFDVFADATVGGLLELYKGLAEHRGLPNDLDLTQEALFTMREQVGVTKIDLLMRLHSLPVTFDLARSAAARVPPSTNAAGKGPKSTSRIRT